MKTLNEVVDIVGLSRRAIQEYEDNGLAVKPKTKNKYGYLLYDDSAIERLWQLRFYKELGYNIPRIQNIFDDNTFNAEDELERVIQELTSKREKLDNMINIAQAMKETGISFNAFRNTIIDESIDFNAVFGVLGTALNLFIDWKEEDCDLDIFTENDWSNIFDAMDRIIDLQKLGKFVDCTEVQEEVLNIHKIVEKGLSKSIILFKGFILFINPDGKVPKGWEGIYDKDNIGFLKSAMEHYCVLNEDNETDCEIIEAINNIGNLGIKKYATNAPEVQSEVNRIHNFYKEVNVCKEEAKLEAVKKIGHLFGSKAYKQAIDNGAPKGVSWFISRAIEIYCKNYGSEK